MPEEMEVVSGEAVMSARTVRKRRIAGIFQHYYPEGNASFLFKNTIVAIKENSARNYFPCFYKLLAPLR